MRLIALLLLMMGLSGCGIFEVFEEPLPPQTDDELPETTIGDPIDLSAPPNITLHTSTETLDIGPFTFCWTDPNQGIGLCADGLVFFSAENAVELDIITIEFAGPLFSSGNISLRSPDLETTIVQQPLDPNASAINWTPDVPAGEYMLFVDLFWQAPDANYGDAFYGISVRLGAE